jgi:hypothetical protein
MDLTGPIGEKLANWHGERSTELRRLTDKDNEHFRDQAWQAHKLATRLLVDAQPKRTYSARVNIFDLDARLPLDPPEDRPDTSIELVLEGAFLVTGLEHTLTTNDIGAVRVSLAITTPEGTHTMPLGETVDPDAVRGNEQLGLPILYDEEATAILQEAARLAALTPAAT